MRSRSRLSRVAGCVAIALSGAVAGGAFAQQQPDLGVAAVKLTDKPYTFDTAEQHGIKVAVVAARLAHPFSLAFLPNGDALVTERGKGLRLVRNAAAAKGRRDTRPEPVAGGPSRARTAAAACMRSRCIRSSRRTHSCISPTTSPAPMADANPPRRQAALTLARGKLEAAAHGVKELFVGEWRTAPAARGSRSADGLLYMTTGAPFDDTAQDLDNVYGKVLRLRDDGKPCRRTIRS